MKLIDYWWPPLLEFMFPRYCATCGKRLYESEQVFCKSCLNKMPRTMYHNWEDNPMAKQFWGKFSIEKATAWFFYTHNSPYAHLIHLFKYHARKELAFKLGKMMATEIMTSGFFDDIDCIIPVPLHKDKERSRGYNQSEWIAHGIAEATGLTVITHAVERSSYTQTQTKKSARERFDNTKGVFKAADCHQLTGKHVLMVDDVITTSATITACADALREVKDIRFSFLALAISD